jgi:hypothetical protein
MPSAVRTCNRTPGVQDQRAATLSVTLRLAEPLRQASPSTHACQGLGRGLKPRLLLAARKSWTTIPTGPPYLQLIHPPTLGVKKITNKQYQPAIANH